MNEYVTHDEFKPVCDDVAQVKNEVHLIVTNHLPHIQSAITYNDGSTVKEVIVKHSTKLENIEKIVWGILVAVVLFAITFFITRGMGQ